MICGELSPHGTQCSLELDHGGTHFSREAECVWLGEGYHMHDCRLVEPAVPISEPTTTGASE